VTEFPPLPSLLRIESEISWEFVIEDTPISKLNMVRKSTGSWFQNDFQEIINIGKGGQGKVYKATNIYDGL